MRRTIESSRCCYDITGDLRLSGSIIRKGRFSVFTCVALNSESGSSSGSTASVCSSVRNTFV